VHGGRRARPRRAAPPAPALLGAPSAQVSCACSVVLFLGWLASTSILGSTLWLFLLGVVIGWQYPLAQAQAYRAAERSGQVVVLGPLVSAFELASPIALGLLADRGGLTLSLVALLAQPVGLLLVLYGVRRGRAASLEDSR
jgi:hypothetical protein